MKKLGEKVYYIGVDDFESDLFESQYVIPEGMAYNSYLILDSKVAILDTSDAIKGEEWKANLKEALQGRKPDYLIVQHMEPDHSSLIGWALGEWAELKVVASALAIRMIPQYFENICLDNRTIAVADGDSLSLGQHTLKFFQAPMVHWPEVIMSHDETDKVLYSADAFGKFGALSKCGFYGRDDDDWSCEARRYYFNIAGKFGVQVRTLLNKLSGTELKGIRPLHGPILEDNLGEYLNLYNTWSAYAPETEGIFIAVASIHGGTMAAAVRLKEILESKGAPKVVLSDLCRSDIAENVEDAFRYPKMIVAASSYEGGVFTPMYSFLHRIGIKGYTNRTVGIVENGSWAPSAGSTMRDMFSKMENVEVLDPCVTIMSRMKSTNIADLEALADNILKSR